MRFTKLTKAFAHELRDRRKAVNLSQEELAERAGIHRTYVSLLERGLKNPTLEVTFRLAEVLNLSPAELVSAVENRIAQSTGISQGYP